MTKYRSALVLGAIVLAFIGGSLVQGEAPAEAQSSLIFGVQISPGSDGQFSYDMAVYDPATGEIVARPQITSNAGDFVTVHTTDPETKSRLKLQLRLEVEPAYEPLPDPPSSDGST